MLFVFVIVPTTLSHELSQDFDWWLGPIFFFLWHIKIVNKDDTFHTKTWTENTSSNLVKLVVNNVLNLVAVSLRTETNLNCHVIFTRKLVEKYILNVDWLTSTSRSNKQSWNKLLDAVFLNVTVTNLIDCCNNYVLNLRVLGELVNLIFIAKINPRLPFVCLWEVNVVIYGATIHAARKDFSALELLEAINFTVADFFEVNINWLTVSSVNDTADWPDASPQETAINNLDVFLLLFTVWERCLAILINIKYLKKTSP